jgi:hypothetical protein
MSLLPVQAADVGPDTSPFWAAAAEDRLVLPRCDACGFVIWYPRPICPKCHSSQVSWFEASRTGVIYSYTVCRKGPGAYQAHVPYVVAYVELAEGPRVLTNIVDADPDSVRIGQRVEALFDRSESGDVLLRFRPATSATEMLP